MTVEFRREYLLRLPLPLAQLYVRAFNAKDARERHDNAFYLFEALVKLLASGGTACYLEEVSQSPAARIPRIDRLLAQLALPSLGQWLAILRELARHFGQRVDATTHPWGGLREELERTRRESPALAALHQRIKNGPDGALAGNPHCSIGELLDALVQYRNGVFGHGAGRFESFYADEMGPLLFPAINEVLSEGFLSLLGPSAARLVHITDLRVLDDGRTQVGLRELVGTQGERMPSLELSAASAAALLPNRVALIWPGRAVPLRLDPLLQYRESELAEEVLFLNRDRNGRQVEYLSYTTGRTERDRSMLPALAVLLSQVTNRDVKLDDLERLSQQSFTETPSVEALLEDAGPPTQAVGEYELLTELGRGGMGVVYLARQRSLGRLVALKTLPQDLAADALSVVRFQREIRHLARCDSPHIVKVLDSGSFADGRLYYTMEYVPGSDLEMVWRELAGVTSDASVSTLGQATWTRAVRSASLKQRVRAEGRSSSGGGTGSPTTSPSPLPEASAPVLQPLADLPDAREDPGGYVRKVVSLIRDVARALHTIHEMGIIHRDVKPANLMLTPDGTRIVLMDFGLAKGSTNAVTATRQGGLLGTLRYAAPEQLAAANIKIGPAVDIRGLGVTLWELLTRRRLFADAEDEVRLTQDVLTSDVPRLRSIDAKLDRDLDAIVARATERRLADRIPTAAQFADLLQLWLDGRPLPIRPPGMGELIVRWAREHAVIATAASVLLIMGLITGTVSYRAWMKRHRESRAFLTRIDQGVASLREYDLRRTERAIAARDVETTALLPTLPPIERQVEALRGELASGALVPADKDAAERSVGELEQEFQRLQIRVQGTADLLAARARRFDVTDEAFQLADGMPGAYGRDGIPAYQKVFRDLAGEDVLSPSTPLTGLVDRLRGLGITEHLRMAADDWLILSYREEELPSRKRLAELASALDQGDEAATRALIRSAILAEDPRALEACAARTMAAESLSADQTMTALLLVDGLLENLRIREAMEVLRHVRQLASRGDPPVFPFLRMWASDVLGVLLNTVGSRDDTLEALQCFESAFAIDPTREVFRLNMAVSYIRLGRPDEALRILAPIEDPALDTMTRVVHGIAFADSGRGVEARQIAEGLPRDKPQSILAHHGAAMIYSEIQDGAEARRLAEAGLRLDPGNPLLLRFVWSEDEEEEDQEEEEEDEEGDDDDLEATSEASGFQAALANIPPRRLKRCWQLQVDALEQEVLAGITAEDSPRVSAAMEKLRGLGVKEWSLSLLEYQALLAGRNWNGDSWERPLRILKQQAPDFISEALPSPMLGALFGQQGGLSNRGVQRLLLREAEVAPSVHPLSRIKRLIASGNLISELEPLMSAEFYEAALRHLPELKRAGYGTDADWSAWEAHFTQVIASIRAPADQPPRERQDYLDQAARQRMFGRAKLESGDLEAARGHFDKYLALVEAWVEKNPQDWEVQAEVSRAYSWLAHVAHDGGALEEAAKFAQQDLAIASQVVEALPDDPQAQIELARAAKSLGEVWKKSEHYEAAAEQFARATATLRALAASHPDDRGLDHLLFHALSTEGTNLLDLDRLDEARKLLREAIPFAEARAGAAPNNMVAQSDLAIIFAHIGQAEILDARNPEALEAFQRFEKVAERMLDSAPGEAEAMGRLTEAYGWIGVAFHRLGKTAEARPYYDREVDIARRTLAATDQVAEARLSLARALGDRAHFLRAVGELDAAVNDLSEALELAPQLAELWSRRGNVYFDLQKDELAIADYTRAIELNPARDEFIRNRANARARQGNFSAADADFASAIELGKDNVLNWHARAEYLAYHARHDESARDFAECLRLEPTNPFLWNTAGIIQIRLRHFTEATTMFREAVRLDPEEPRFHHHLAIALAELQRWEEAADEYERLLKGDYKFPTVRSEAALIARHQGDRTKYQAILQDLQRRYLAAKETTDPDAVAWALARFAGSSDEPPIPQDLFERAPAQAKEKDPLYPRTRGALALRETQFEEAERWFRAAIAQDEPDDPPTLALLAWTLRKSIDAIPPGAERAAKIAARIQEATGHAARAREMLTATPPQAIPGWATRLETEMLLSTIPDSEAAPGK